MQAGDRVSTPQGKGIAEHFFYNGDGTSTGLVMVVLDDGWGHYFDIDVVEAIPLLDPLTLDMIRDYEYDTSKLNHK